MYSNLIFACLLLLVPDLLVWTGMVAGAGIGSKTVCSTVTLIQLLIMLNFLTKWTSWITRTRLFFICFLMLVLPKVVFALVGWPLGWCAGMIAALVLMMTFTYGFTYGWVKLKIRHEEIVSSQLPVSFDGYRILQFSDLHLGTFMYQPWFIDKLFCEMRAQDADLVVFTGDLVNIKANEAAIFVNMLSQISAPDGVYSVLGNHDYFDVPGAVIHMEEQLGWKVLNDTHCLIERNGAHIALIGVQHVGEPPFISHGNLSAAMDGVPNGIFKILLSHNPSHWRREIVGNTDIQLTLSGHTHAAQMRIGPFSPARLMYREWGGWYVQGNQWLYVSIGLGGTIPFRLIAWPEINVITLRVPDEHKQRST